MTISPLSPSRRQARAEKPEERSGLTPPDGDTLNHPLTLPSSLGLEMDGAHTGPTEPACIAGSRALRSGEGPLYSARPGAASLSLSQSGGHAVDMQWACTPSPLWHWTLYESVYPCVCVQKEGNANAPPTATSNINITSRSNRRYLLCKARAIRLRYFHRRPRSHISILRTRTRRVGTRWSYSYATSHKTSPLPPSITVGLFHTMTGPLP